MKGKKLTKRFWALVFIGLAVIGATACGGKEQKDSAGDTTVTAADNQAEAAKETAKESTKQSTGETSGDVITVTWWNEYTDTEMAEKIQQYIIAPFEEANPKIKIDMQGKGDYDRVLQTALSTKNGPDLFATNGPAYSMQFAVDGMLEDLTKYEEQYDWSLVMDWALDSCRYQEKLYSIPVTTETCFLFYNVDLFEENGWEPPKTYQELLTLCDAMMEKDIIPFGFGAQDFKPSNEWWTTLAFNYYAGRDNVAKALRGELPWNSEIMVKSMEELNHLWQKGYITHQQSHEITMTDGLSLFGSKKAGMVGWATWLLKDLPKYCTDSDFDFVKWPVWNPEVENSMIVGLGSCIAINANAPQENKDAAACFLNYLLEDKDRAAEIAVNMSAELWIPMQYDTETFPENTDPKFLRVVKEFNAIPEDAPGLSMWTFWPPKFETYLYENIERVYLGQISAQELMDEGQKIFEEELAAGVVPVIPGR